MSSLKEEKKSSKEELSPPDYQKSDLEKSDDEVGLEMSTRLDAVGVDGVYERKVYIVNRIMNEHIGMGKFQWQLFALSGFGWFVDNIWLQGVAIILPQIKTEFGVEHSQWMTFALYIGLIIGAFTWGIMADVVGRRLSFNITLFLAGVFGIVGGGAPSFVGLGGILAALGTGLGGNLPVDGMLFLEFIPGANQYLLTLLSVFWSIGQLFASLIAWAFIANYSCADNETNVPSIRAANPTYTACLKENNMGWRYTFYTLGAVTFVLFVARFFFFRLPESPKYLVAKGRDADAVATLKEIGRRNGVELGDDIISVAILRSAAGQETSMDQAEEEPTKEGLGALMNDMKTSAQNFKISNLKPDMSHVTPLFAGSWALAYNTTVIILLWGIIGLAYPLYNAFLPTYLAQRTAGMASSTYQTYRDYAIISVCGVPGSIIAAWMVDLPRSGRRGAMSIGTLATGAFLFGFTTAKNEAANLGFNCAAALTQNIMYGVLYSYTPESFPAPHRGTGDGIAASFNRLTGLMAPIIAIYAADNANVPVYVSAALFLVAGLLMITLRIESQGKTAL